MYLEYQDPLDKQYQLTDNDNHYQSYRGFNVITINPGSKFIIKSIPKKFLQKMLSVGINRNTEVTVCRIAPFNGLVQIKLGNLNLGLRQADFLQLELMQVE